MLDRLILLDRGTVGVPVRSSEVRRFAAERCFWGSLGGASVKHRVGRLRAG
jgi:hypothetical protein